MFIGRNNMSLLHLFLRFIPLIFKIVRRNTDFSRSRYNIHSNELSEYTTMSLRHLSTVTHVRNKTVVTTFFSLCLEILTWFLVYECIMMSYRSSLHLVPVQWFLVKLWHLDLKFGQIFSCDTNVPAMNIKEARKCFTLF
jgi:hypothetical protein